MINEKDLRVMKERSKDYERAALKALRAKEAREARTRNRSTSTLARLVGLFL
jgi:hypothetical protein